MAIVLALLTSVFYGLADFTSGHLTKRVSAFAVVGGASIVAAVIYLILGLRSDLMVFEKVDFVAGIVSGTLFFIRCSPCVLPPLRSVELEPNPRISPERRSRRDAQPIRDFTMTKKVDPPPEAGTTGTKRPKWPMLKS
ncbi:MAG: hypothetical protein F2797_05065 [Actinobacteria bacterium]|uniref:Unannotated protein n=1 Tax=freshwater metagenome TaxID=449393 RepID=A0A6J7E4C6_9ZZZZ|nr:hypothetical protein [Actinomycetota bacterium]